MKFDNNEICSIFPIGSLVFYVCEQNFDFLRKTDKFWANISYIPEFFWAKSIQKTCLYVHEKLQRNSSVESCLKFFTFRPYGFDHLGFLTDACRGATRSKTQWVFYRDLNRLMAQTTKSPIRRNHWVPLGCRTYLGSVKEKIPK